MLKITIDGRKAALDLRIIDEKYHFDTEGKISKCAKNVAQIYFEHNEDNSTQLVFCDSSIPKKEFNAYDELKFLLISKGIPASKIAYVYDATTDKARDELFKKVSAGEIRILIGSTFKLGIGVNVQEKLFAIHHLDIPWKPGDMIQREGRVLREGNTNNHIEIYRYITEGTFDAYSYQILENKQNFISQLLSNNLNVRTGEDVDEAVLSYAEIKALAIGDPLIKKRVEKANEISHLNLLQNDEIKTRNSLKQELNEIPLNIKKIKEENRRLNEENLNFVNYVGEYDKNELKNFRHILMESLNNVDLKEEKFLFSYKNLEIYSPKEMRKDKPFIIVKSKIMTHILALGNSEERCLSRIEFYFKSKLLSLIKENNEKIREYKIKKQEIENSLVSRIDYEEEIKKAKEELAKIDLALGVAENE